jgi:hypothetical protein
MKNVYDVLRQKEVELSKLEIEVEALRMVAPLLTEEGEAEPENTQQIRLASGKRETKNAGHNMASESTRDLDTASPLKQAIRELQRLHEVSLAGDLEPRILTDFRDCRNFYLFTPQNKYFSRL